MRDSEFLGEDLRAGSLAHREREGPTNRSRPAKCKGDPDLPYGLPYIPLHYTCRMELPLAYTRCHLARGTHMPTHAYHHLHGSTIGATRPAM